MATPGHVNGQSRRSAFRNKPRRRRISGDLIVMATLMGVARALFGRKKPPAMQRARAGLQPSTRGREAETGGEIPAKGWKDIAWRIYQSSQNNRVLLVAAGVTYYALLALFPAVAAIVTLYGLFADTSSLNEDLHLLSGFLPQGALEVIGDQVKRITAQGQARLGFTLLGTLGLSLWGANAGTKAIFDALNIIYKEREQRGFIKLTLCSLAFTVAAVVLALLSLTGIVLVPVALKFLGLAEGSWAGLLALLRWPLLYLVIVFGLACLYRYGPSRTEPQWRWVTWGSAIAAAIWIVGSLLLSWYVTNFGTYNATYGSLGAVIGFMVWLWLSTTIVLIGGEINAEMEHQTAKDTTEGANKPMGTRGARMADEIGKAHA